MNSEKKPLENSEEENLDLDEKVESKPKKSKTSVSHKGALLKSVREQKGLSLELIHETTKIPMDALRAIEEGYKVRTLSDFYYKGFLKIYAQYLGVDISDVIDNYQEETLPQYVKKDVEDFKFSNSVSTFLTHQRKQQIVLVLAALFALFVLSKLLGWIFHRPAKEKSVQTQVANVKQKPVAKESDLDKSKRDELEKSKKEELNRQKRLEEERLLAQRRAAQKNKKTVSAPIVSAPSTLSDQSNVPSRNVVLTVRAKKKTWLRVKADDEIVFQSTLEIGAVETWLADDKIEIVGRDIDELEFELNGKMIGGLGSNYKRVKELVATKNGLEVIK